VILQIIEWMLGSTGRALLEFIKNNTQLFNILASVYLLFLGVGHLQLKNIKKKTEILTLEIATPLVTKNPEIPIKEIFNIVNPVWISKIDSWAKFIPHRLEFYVVKATQANVLEKFKFSPKWIEELLVSKKMIKSDDIKVEKGNGKSQKK